MNYLKSKQSGVGGEQEEKGGGEGWGCSCHNSKAGISANHYSRAT